MNVIKTVRRSLAARAFCLCLIAFCSLGMASSCQKTEFKDINLPTPLGPIKIADLIFSFEEAQGIIALREEELRGFREKQLPREPRGATAEEIIGYILTTISKASLDVDICSLPGAFLEVCKDNSTLESLKQIDTNAKIFTETIQGNVKNLEKLSPNAATEKIIQELKSPSKENTVLPVDFIHIYRGTPYYYWTLAVANNFSPNRKAAMRYLYEGMERYDDDINLKMVHIGYDALPRSLSLAIGPIEELLTLIGKLEALLDQEEMKGKSSIEVSVPGTTAKRTVRLDALRNRYARAAAYLQNSYAYAVVEEMDIKRESIAREYISEAVKWAEDSLTKNPSPSEKQSLTEFRVEFLDTKCLIDLRFARNVKEADSAAKCFSVLVGTYLREAKPVDHFEANLLSAHAYEARAVVELLNGKLSKIAADEKAIEGKKGEKEGVKQ